MENEILRKKFDSYCKKILRNRKIDLDRKRRVERRHNVPFDSLGRIQINQLSVTDRYDVLQHVFYVYGVKVVIQDTCLATAIFELDVLKQKIVLLYYFLGFNDREIASLMELSEDQVWYRRRQAIREIEKGLEVLYERKIFDTTSAGD